MPDSTGLERSPEGLAAAAVRDGTLVTDLPCTICGYNLRGLVVAGVCPECGAAVSRSLHGLSLGFANPVWLQNLCRGTTLLLWALGIRVLADLLGGWTMHAIGIPDILPVVLTLVAAALDVSATFLATVREPHVAPRCRALNLRRTIRVCALLAAGAVVIRAADLTVQVPVLAETRELMFLFSLAQHVGFLLYLRCLMLRAPCDFVTPATMPALVGLTVVMALSGLLIIGGLLATPLGRLPAGRFPSSLLINFGCVGILGTVAIGASYFWAVLHCREALGYALAFARLQPRIGVPAARQ